MVQGTGSDVGKSVIVAALCRIFSNTGVNVAPFKAQNMALNSFVTPEGGEVGRSTALQAKAARVPIQVEMNPILLKPKSDKEAQLVMKGRPYADISAYMQFHQDQSLRMVKWKAICDSLGALSKSYDLIVIEGAGSPAEVNLREFDLVNMAVAIHARAPVLLVSDIDRGGAIAALVGTLALLTEKERQQVKGFIINKFRGDKRLFDPAIDFLRERTGCPTLGVVSYDHHLSLMEEDALRENQEMNGVPEIEIAVISHQHLSNFTDIDPLRLEPGVMIRYVRGPAQLGRPDAVILPGTKNTIADLRAHYASGLASRIQSLATEGVPIIGICGGYQMMGKALMDPQGLESSPSDIDGLGLLDIVTKFHPGKITRQARFRLAGYPPFLGKMKDILTGYEIHAGVTRPVRRDTRPAFIRMNENETNDEGSVSQDGVLFGSMMHGLFENDLFRRRFIDTLRGRKHLEPLPLPLIRFTEFEDRQIEHWAERVEKALDMSRIEEILDDTT